MQAVIIRGIDANIDFTKIASDNAKTKVTGGISVDEPYQLYTGMILIFLQL
jgi:hypothetical protein